MMALMDASMIAPFTQYVASSLINAISGEGVMRAGKGEESRFNIAFNDRSSGKRI